LTIIGACPRIVRVAWRILHWGWAKKCPDKMSDMLWALGQFRGCSSPKAQGNSGRAISSKIV
jgi:hypothetical protein